MKNKAYQYAKDVVDKNEGNTNSSLSMDKLILLLDQDY